MSGLEIERKFLVRKDGAFKRDAFSSSHIQQGYIPCLNATVRIRVRDDEAYLTIKGKSTHGGMTRYEFETKITLDEASHLLQLCQGGVIDKRRYLVKSGNHVFEVDEFYGDNEGLVMAEVELKSEMSLMRSQILLVRRSLEMRASTTNTCSRILFPLGKTRCQKNTDKQ